MYDNFEITYQFLVIIVLFVPELSSDLCVFRTDISKCLSHVESLEESLLRVASLEWPLLSNQRALTHLCTTTVLRKQTEDKKSKVCILLFVFHN